MASSGVPGPGTPKGDRSPRGRRMWVLVVVVVVAAAAAFGAGYYLLSSTAPANRPPVAVIHTSNAAPVTYDTVTFNASASSDPDGDALTYAWSAPGGLTSDLASFNYTYHFVGVFSFKLTVTDPHGANSSTSLNVTVHPAPLTVGTNTPYPPFESYNGTTLVGFDIDLANAVALQAGYAAQWHDFSDFSVLLQTVASSGVDMAASGITSSGTIGAERNLSMYFSTPYFVVIYGVLVQRTSNLTCPSSGCTPTDLANRTIGVVSGTTGELWVDDNLVATNVTPSSDVMRYAEITMAVSALDAGSVSMVLLESFAASSIANSSSGALRVAGVIDTGETYSFAFPRTVEGLALANRINLALDAVVISGIYGRLYAKWFAP